jgi:hypothetical protein
VGRHEAEALVEAVGVRALLVRRELDQAAAPPLRLVDRPAQHDLAEAGAPPSPVDPDALHQRPPAPEAGEAGDERQLEDARRRAIYLGHDQQLVRVALDRLPG